MEQRRTEFPALEARRSDLEHQHFEARQQAEDAARTGKPDNAIMQWIVTIRAELDELSYVLRAMADREIAIGGRPLKFALALFVLIAAAQLTVLALVGK